MACKLCGSRVHPSHSFGIKLAVEWRNSPHTPSRSSTRCRAASAAEERSVRAAARQAVDAFVKSGSVIGLGHGKLVLYVLECLSDRIDKGLLKEVSCLSASSMTSVEAAVHGIPIRDFNDNNLKADITLLEADEVDCHGDRLAAITGRAYEGPSAQQPQLPLLRQLLSRSTESVALVAGAERSVRRMGGALPVFIEGDNWEDTAEALDDKFLGDAEVWRRPREGTANPRGGAHPYISKEGHNIVDIRFLTSLKLFGELVPYQKISDEILEVEGVLTHGLLLEGVNAAVIASGEEAKIVEKGLLLGFKDKQ